MADEKQEPAPEQAPEQEPEQRPLAVGNGIHSRVGRVMARMRTLEREGHMRGPGANFDYATIDQLRELLRPLMGEEGLTLTARRVRVFERSERTSSNGKAQFDTILRVRWVLACDNGEEIKLESFGRSLNSSDKDFNTALTYAERNVLLSTFHASSGEDPEQERPEAESGARVRAPKGRGPAGDYRAPTAQADPVPVEMKEEAARCRLVLAEALNKRGEENPDEKVTAFIVTKAHQINPELQVQDFNRTEFEALLSHLRDQVEKLVPGYDTKTGELRASEAPKAPDDQDVPEPPAAPQAPAPREPAPVAPEVQQQIEADAAKTPMAGAPVDPDGAPPSIYDEALAEAERAGMTQGQLLGLMMDAGAAKPEDLEEEPVKGAFLEKLAEALNELAPTKED